MSLALIAESYVAKVDNDGLEAANCKSEKPVDGRRKAKDNKLNGDTKLINGSIQRRRSKRKRAESPVKESIPEDKIEEGRLGTDLQDESNAAGGGGRSSRKKSKTTEENGETSSGDKNVIVDLDQTWPFKHYRIVLQREDAIDDVGEGEGSEKLESGWDLQGSKFVFYDRITSSEVKQMRDELESSKRTKSSTSLHLTTEPLSMTEVFLNGAVNGENEELKNSVSSSQQRTTKQKQRSVHPPRKKITSGARRKSQQAVEVASDPDNNVVATPTVTQTENGKAEKVLKIEAVFKCPYCLIIFPEAGVMIQHLEAQSCQMKTDKVINSKCNGTKSSSTKKATPSKPSVQPEEKDSTLLNGDTRQDQSGKCNRLECVICGESFARIYELDHHMNLHSGELPFKCPLCSDGFPDLSSIDKHVRKAHEIGKETSLLELLERSKTRKACETGKNSPSPNEDLPPLGSRSRTRTNRKASQ